MGLYHPTAEDFDLPTVLHALSDPQRLQMVRELAEAEEELPCSGFAVSVSKSTCTHHFRVLREAGVVQQRQLGTSKLNTLRRAELDARFPGLLDAVLAAGPAPVPA
ncbi:MAG TPA: helix-turn-helix transcriptional regulator [Solirubrobacteraceae bacterium]|nr:helix-turn-helix transcriptional regulator [Solirubrobacteraceae bacterium]